MMANWKEFDLTKVANLISTCLYGELKILGGTPHASPCFDRQALKRLCVRNIISVSFD